MLAPSQCVPAAFQDENGDLLCGRCVCQRYGGMAAARAEMGLSSPVKVLIQYNLDEYQAREAEADAEATGRDPAEDYMPAVDCAECGSILAEEWDER